jgi:hypothetical protein
VQHRIAINSRSEFRGVFHMRQMPTNPATIAVLEQLQEQMRDVCHPHQYDEFYRVTTERGFTKITIPKTKTAA